MALPPALQNKNVQIGLIALAILIALVVLFTQFMGGNSAAPSDAYMGPTGGTSMSGGPPGGPPGPGGTGYPGPPGGSGYPGPGGVAAGYGTDTSGSGAPVPAAKTVSKKAGPRPPARPDPFKRPAVLIPEPTPIADNLPPDNTYVQSRAEEISKPTPDQFIREAPDPPMRMAGALWGNRVYGVLEINGKTELVHPGSQVGIYRVEQIQRDRIVMSRPARHGRRTVDALLAGNPALEGQYPTGDNGIPGGPTGYGGPPGAGSGGPAGSGGSGGK